MHSDVSFHLKPDEEATAKRWTSTYTKSEGVSIEVGVSSCAIFGTKQQINQIEEAMAANFLRRRLNMPDATDIEVLAAALENAMTPDAARQLARKLGHDGLMLSWAATLILNFKPAPTVEEQSLRVVR
jgi:hypothetical protein